MAGGTGANHRCSADTHDHHANRRREHEEGRQHGVPRYTVRAHRGGAGAPKDEDACGAESKVRVIFNADNRAHAEDRLKDFVKTYATTQPKLAAWAEENLPEGFTVFAMPESHSPMPKSNPAPNADRFFIKCF